MGGTIENVLADLSNLISEVHQLSLAISDTKCKLIPNHKQEKEQQTLNGLLFKGSYAIHISANVEVKWMPLGIMPCPARSVLVITQAHYSQ